MTDEELYATLGDLVANVPDLGGKANPPRDPAALRWLGKVVAVVEAEGDVGDTVTIKLAARSLGSLTHASHVGSILTILYQTLAAVEMRLPAAARGAYIGVGNSADGLGAVAGVMVEAKTSIMLIDPYVGERAVLAYAPLAAEGVFIGILGDTASIKPGLKPAAEAWHQQHGAKRPLEARAAPARSLHDRLLIVDNSSVWVLSQSFEHLAARSPASILRAPDDVAALKVPHYQGLWASAAVVCALPPTGP